MLIRRVDSEWYLKKYPDVAASGMSAEEHYRNFGKYEGRMPREPDFFDRFFLRASIFFKALKLISIKHHGYFGAIKIVYLEIKKNGAQGLKGTIVRTLREHDRHESRVQYAAWIQKNELGISNTYNARALLLQENANAPKISVVMATFNTPVGYLQEAIDSVTSQAYANWQLFIADDCSTNTDTIKCLKSYEQRDKRIKVIYRNQNGHISEATNSALTLADGDYVAFMDHDDKLHPTALATLADWVTENQNAELIYSDEDKIDDMGNRSDPNLKPDFNYELLLTQNYICHLVVIKQNLLIKIGNLQTKYDGAQDHEFILRAVEHTSAEKILHIPHVLYHWRVHAQSTASSTSTKPYAINAGRAAVKAHLERIGIRALVTEHPEVKFWHKVRFELVEKPSIEIFIPTRDRIELMQMCINSILKKTSYKNYSVTIIDNGSVEPESLEQFSSWSKIDNIRVIRDESEFNYSRLNNRAVQQSSADLICLLNNDIEIISPDWLEEMAGLAMREDTGCVGARLWYPNDTLQHGGVILGIGGVAGHAHKYLPKGDPGYCGRAVSLQALSAVTAACLMVKRSIYNLVGGLDEALMVAFNDIDFCLRVRNQGYRNIWTPYAQMYHHESASRGREDNPAKVERFNNEIKLMQDRWGNQLNADPYYSPNLTLDHEDFTLSDISRVLRD